MKEVRKAEDKRHAKGVCARGVRLHDAEHVKDVPQNLSFSNFEIHLKYSTTYVKLIQIVRVKANLTT